MTCPGPWTSTPDVAAEHEVAQMTSPADSLSEGDLTRAKETARHCWRAAFIIYGTRRSGKPGPFLEPDQDAEVRQDDEQDDNQLHALADDHAATLLWDLPRL